MANKTMDGAALKKDFTDCAGREDNPYNIKIRDVNDPHRVITTLCFDSMEDMCAHLRENPPPHNHGYYDLSAKNLTGANLEGAHLVYTDFSNSTLDKANLKNADMLGATLLHTSLRMADLEGAELAASEATGADFGSSNLSDDQFSAMLGWPRKLADGSLPPGHPDEKKQEKKKKTFGMF